MEGEREVCTYRGRGGGGGRGRGRRGDTVKNGDIVH